MEGKKKGKLILIIIAVIVVAAIVALVVVYFNKPDVKLGRALQLPGTDERIAESAKVVMDADPALGAEAQALLSDAMAEDPSGTVVLDIALTAKNLAEQGLDAAFADDCVTQALSNVNYSMIIQANRAESLQQLAEYLSNEDWIDLLKKCYTLSDDTLANIVLGLERDLSEDDIMAIAFVMTENGRDGNQYLIEKYPDMSVEKACEILAGTGDAQLEQCAAALAVRFTDSQDVLSYIRECKKMGVNPSVVYPEGVVLEMDLADVTLNGFSGIMHETNTYLVISRSEKEEPVEGRATDPNFVGSSNGYIDAVKAINGGSFGRNYDGNDKSDPENYTVVLETALMDKIPLENLPASLDECSYMILLDSIYSFNGYLTKKTSMSTTQFSNIQSAQEYPVYACVQSAWICAAPDWDYIYRHDYIVTNPPEPPATMDAMSYLFFDIEDYLRGERDEEWAARTANEMIQGLSDANWNMSEYMLAMF